MKLQFNPNSKTHKTIGKVALFAMLFQIFHPTTSWSQSSGSSQTSSSGGTPSSQMVNLFTGDFNYSIPLMNVDGFPLTLTYNGNTTMNQEASWVGLGWDLNPGAINREMRGLPDDFDGDIVTKILSVKDNVTDGVNVGVMASLGAGVGISAAGITASASISVGIEVKGGVFNNTYTGDGFNFETGASLTTRLGIGFKGASIGGSYGQSIGLSANSANGIGLSSSETFGINAGFSKQGEGISVNYSKTNGITNSTRSTTQKYVSHSIGYQIENENLKEKRTSGGGSISGSSSISLGTKTYVPATSNKSIYTGSFNRKELGVSLDLISVNMSIAGLHEKYDNTGTVISTYTNPAYGYLHLEDASTSSSSLLDFNRENEGVISESMKILPVTNLTYDIFRETGGAGGTSFRPYRNDIGTVNNSAGITMSLSTSETKALEIALPIPYGIGSSYEDTKGYSFSLGLSGKYNNPSNNLAGNNLAYRSINSTPESETYYFKTIGESIPYDETIFNNYGGNKPSALEMVSLGNVLKLNSRLQTYSNAYNWTTTNLPTNNYTNKKQNRNTIYTEITASEAGSLGIPNYSLNDTLTPSTESISSELRVIGKKKAHHLSLISVTKPGGTRYNYDVPVYSLTEKSVTFNVSETSNVVTDSSNLVTFSGSDNSTSNTNGRDHLYTSTTVPGYAHSFLLGSILSKDYGDRTGDGITEDDYGNYIKFGYSRVFDETTPFKWKSPYNEGATSQASYMENNKSYDDDDFGHYQYGEKEMWYVNTIEGKNYVAKFYLSDRDDLFSVSNEGGALDVSNAAKKLDKIVLYSKEDLATNSNNATPIQTVHFEYDYSLCKDFNGNRYNGASDNTSGKLTLKEVYVTYKDSKKGRLSPYEFSYDGTNAFYNGNNVDRWGVNKPNGIAGNSNIDHPYAYQDSTQRAGASSSWSLTNITLPSGGTINIEYESDDYASVQGKKPMLMVPIAGFGYSDDINSATPTSLAFRKSNDYTNFRNVVYLDLPNDIDQSSTANAKADFYNKYLKQFFEDPLNPKKIFYQCEVETKKGTGDYEIVTGYFDAIDYGVDNSYNPYIILKMEKLSDGSQTNPMMQMLSFLVDFQASGYTNPIMKDALQHLRTNVSRAIFPDGVGNSASVDFMTVLVGLYPSLNLNNFAWKIKSDESYLRLTEPTGKKLGGGNRVKQITYSDSWSDMVTGEDSYTYGQVYTYTNDEGNSSGVVQYEPQIGKGLNPLRYPVEFKIENVGYPWDFHYHSAPFGESFYDAPVIGYSQVKVESIDHLGFTDNKGSVVYEYYTTDDAAYRTKVSNTPIASYCRVDTELSAWETINGVTDYNLLGMTQGFCIEKNDMHGKLKKVTNLNAQDIEVSSEKYIYKGFDELCKVINSDGSIENKVIGKDFDFVHDIIYTTQISNASSTTKIYRLGIPPYNKSSYSSSQTQGYVLSSFTKVIHNYAVLDRVETRYLGALTVSKNLAYDALTGNVIATTTNNEYDDEIKSLSYPAYWYYNGMGQAVNTINNHLVGVDITSDGIIEVSNSYDVEDYFRQADELLIEWSGGSSKAWVLDVDVANNNLFLIDDVGGPLTAQSNVNIRVIRSGYRNQQITSMSSFTDLDPTLTNLDANKVVGASAVEYSENWKMYCGDCNPQVNSIANPFEHGLLGVWRTNKSYAYQIDRSEISTSIDVDLREGGTYSAYAPFYASVSGTWYSILDALHPNYDSGNTEKWLLANEITNFNQSGAPVEAKDVLGRYSGVLFKYNNNEQKIPVAAANNAKNTDLAFDGFEDYINYAVYVENKWCATEGHFDFERSATYAQIATTEAHTGRYSLKLADGDSVTVTRLTDTSALNCPTAISTDGYKIRECDCKSLFSPQSGKYIISAWVKEDAPGTKALFDLPEIIVKTYKGILVIPNDTLRVMDGITIDGWQQIEGTFTIPVGGDSLEVVLRHTGEAGEAVYFDDLRIHPFNSTMVTSVYDPVSFRKWADLDDYNYATFYEYNEQGIMIRVKQETINGIKTISETRSSTVKH